MRKIYLVRHGQTELNKQRLIQGELDSSLTRQGLEEIETCGSILTAEIHKDKVLPATLVSSAPRALVTLGLLQQDLDLVPYYIYPELWEKKWGQWEGLSWESIPERHPEQYKEFERDMRHYCGHGGESYQDHMDRLSRIVYYLKANSALPFLVVAHQTTNCLISAMVRKGDADEGDFRRRLPHDAVIVLSCEESGAWSEKILK